MRTTGALAVVVLAAALGAATSTPALAGPKPRVNLSSQGGQLALGQDGSATVSGPVAGAPFDGQYTAVLTADDGSLPEPGGTEPATATVTIIGLRGQQVVLTGSGEVTGESVGPNASLTHKFTGRYTADSSVRRVDGTDGWYSVGVAATMSLGYFEAFDS
jgi:hypothetical protein